MKWLETEEFKNLRKGFVPTDNSEEVKQEGEEWEEQQ